MESKRRIEDVYYDWIYQKVSDRRYDRYGELIYKLHNTEFYYVMDEDENRYEDGINLREKFAYEIGINIDDYRDAFDFNCTILEMMVALSIRLEQQFMHDCSKGSRIGQWFWEMIMNLGLDGMTNDNYDERRVNVILERFLNRKYTVNGKGGLFVIKRKNVDVRKYEIWYQACWYLDDTHGESD